MSRFWTFSELGRERIKKSSRQSFFVLTWPINLSCCPVLSASFKFLAKRPNIGRKKTWNLVVIDRLYSSVLFWYLLTINCLNFVLVPSPRRLRKAEKAMGTFFSETIHGRVAKFVFAYFWYAQLHHVGKWNGSRDRLVTEPIFWVELWITMTGGSREIFPYGLGEMGSSLFGEVCKSRKHLVAPFQ